VHPMSVVVKMLDDNSEANTEFSQLSKPSTNDLEKYGIIINYNNSLKRKYHDNSQLEPKYKRRKIEITKSTSPKKYEY